jgi:RNA polymerase sigma-70 factor (ECF subfamily)
MDRADDLVQNACECALRQSTRGPPETHLESWLYRIMRRAWIDQQHRGDLSPRAPLDDAGDLPSAEGGSRAEDWLMLDEVYREIMQLPEEQRTVLTLVSIDSLSYREAAEILEVPIGTVMSRLSRARLALAQRLKAPPPEPGNVLKRR